MLLNCYSIHYAPPPNHSFPLILRPPRFSKLVSKIFKMEEHGSNTSSNAGDCRSQAKAWAEKSAALKKRRAAFNTVVANAESAASRAAAKLQVFGTKTYSYTKATYSLKMSSAISARQPMFCGVSGHVEGVCPGGSWRRPFRHISSRARVRTFQNFLNERTHEGSPTQGIYQFDMS